MHSSEGRGTGVDVKLAVFCEKSELLISLVTPSCRMKAGH